MSLPAAFRSHRFLVTALTVSVTTLTVSIVSGCATSGPAATRSPMAAPTAQDSLKPVQGPRLDVFPTSAFAHVSEEPVSNDMAADLQRILDDAADGVGMAATVMSPAGTWSGAAGKADGVRDVRVDDQFAIASLTKSVIAAQIMQMIEAGELALDDPATAHLPPELDFDTNHATIRQLLGMHSGIPDYVAGLWGSLSTDRQQNWMPAEVLALVPATRSVAGVETMFSDTNYVVLGLVVEQLRGRPLADVLRNGVLSGDGLERLIYQPDEAPTEPMAMPGGESTAALEKGGGYLPSLAAVTGAFGTGAMASDAPSLARWWRAFCAGEIVSEASLTEMATMHDGYGLGLHEGNAYQLAPGLERLPERPGALGHGGNQVGYTSLAACLPEDGAVVVVLSNGYEGELSAIAGPLVASLLSD